MNNNSSTNPQDDIVLNENGEAYNPINQNPFLLTLKLILCLVGIPLNGIVAVAIISCRRLRCKPRNIFLLAITLSFMAFFIPAMIELHDTISSSTDSDSACRSHVAFVGVPHGLLLLNMSLALVDRYVAIKKPLLHREKMTPRLACGIAVSSSAFLVFLLKFVFIVELETLHCEMSFVHIKFLTIIIAILFVTCIGLDFFVYRETKALLLREPQLMRTSAIRRERIELVDISREQRGNHVRANNIRSDGMSVHVNIRKLRKMEVEATRTLITGVTSMVVTAFLGVIFASIVLVCQLFDQFECSHLNWMGPYFKELGLIPAVYSPIIFLVRSKELRASLTCKM